MLEQSWLASPTLWTVLATFVTTLVGVFVTYWLTGTVRLIAFSPGSAPFVIHPTDGTSPPFHVKAGHIVIQNEGRKTAKQVQLASSPAPPPAGYVLLPPLDHSVRTGPQGEWIIEIPFIGPRETVILQMLNGPMIDSIRSEDGPAKYVQVMYQRVYPVWVKAFVAILMLAGLVALLGGGAILIWQALS